MNHIFENFQNNIGSHYKEYVTMWAVSNFDFCIHFIMPLRIKTILYVHIPQIKIKMVLTI